LLEMAQTPGLLSSRQSLRPSETCSSVVKGCFTPAYAMTACGCSLVGEGCGPATVASAIAAAKSTSNPVCQSLSSWARAGMLQRLPTQVTRYCSCG
jgi:hypothetical protein